MKRNLLRAVAVALVPFAVALGVAGASAATAQVQTGGSVATVAAEDDPIWGAEPASEGEVDVPQDPIWG
ncbi:hypothetical protein AB0L71_18945 [Streptomyces sp. NPDC052052]|uniref:hypothetical protein n=1 Tax=Streptomyces sp. NPDC052052 TaxID=3154756 RepID=UPI003416BD75